MLNKNVRHTCVRRGAGADRRRAQPRGREGPPSSRSFVLKIRPAAFVLLVAGASSFDDLFDRVGATGLALYGRKLWETMSSYWPTADQQPGGVAVTRDTFGPDTVLRRSGGAGGERGGLGGSSRY